MSHQALDQTPSSPSKPSNDDSQDLPPYSPYDDSPVSPTSSYPPTSPSSSLAPSAPVSPSTDKHEDPTNQDESHAEDNTLEEKLIDCTSVWNRVPPPELLCVSFTPTCTIPTYGNSLSKGFPAMPPHINVVPHPFTSNDVTDQDWKLFITHLQETARVTKKEKQKANSSIPMLGVIPLVGPAVRYGVRSYLASKKPASAGQVVDTWNRMFFHPRKLEVSLWKGSKSFSHSQMSDDSVAPPPPTPFILTPLEAAKRGDVKGKKQHKEKEEVPFASGSRPGEVLPSTMGKDNDDRWRLYVAPFNGYLKPLDEIS